MKSTTGKKQSNKNANAVDVTVFGDSLSFAAHEAYRLLRTNLTFSFAEEGKCRVVGVVSAIKGEGKTTTAINLAYVLAENGAKVCLIDGDMRMPQVAKRLEVEAKYGLSEVLTGQCPLQKAIEEKKFKNCSYSVVSSGRIPPNPSELLSSDAMRNMVKLLSEQFEYVIIDLPPIDVVSDAIVLSDVLDGIIMTVSEGFVKKKMVKLAMRQLALANIRVIGFVRTFVSVGGFGSYKSKYKYGKYGKYGKDGYGYGGYEHAADHSDENQ